MNELPPADTEEQYEALDAGELEGPVRVLCERLGLPTATVKRFEEGSLPVYAVGEGLVLKLYPPVFAHEVVVESAALRALEGQLPVPTPGVRGTGRTVAGWSYLLMDRLPGESLREAWPRISTTQRRVLMERAGETLAQLHRVPPPAELGPGDWRLFLAEQRATVVGRQRALGLGEEWLGQIPAFLDSIRLPETTGAFLHTEFMPVHLLVQETDEGWGFSGLFDFEPALRGAPEYDVVAAALFVTRGDPVLLGRLLDGYGYARESRAALPKVLMAYTLLHGQCHLPWFIRELGVGEAQTLEGLARHWFSSAAG